MAAFTVDAATKIGGVHIKVSGLDRARRFYGERLGFGIEAHPTGILALRGGEGDPLILLSARQDAVPRPRRSTGLYHFAVRLPSRAALGRFLRHAGALGIRFQGASDHGVSEALYLADPDGNGIEIYADRPPATWRKPGQGLDMGTAPLDVDDILAAVPADAPTWEGMPAGTDIGHVHLHVADLDAAERFYCDGLGLDLQMRYGGSALFMSAGGYHHHVGANTWAGVGAPPPPEEAVGLRYFVLQLPDAGALTALVDHLAHVDIRAAQDDGTFWVSDPSGNRIALTAAGLAHLP